MRLVRAHASNGLQANTPTKTQINRKQNRNSGIKAKIFKTHHLSPSLPCYPRFILYIQLQRATYTPVRKEFSFKNQNCHRNMINNYLRKWRLIIVSVFTAQKPTNLFIAFIIFGSEIQVFTHDFVSSAAKRFIVLAIHFRTSQSARAESIIYLFGIY